MAVSVYRRGLEDQRGTGSPRGRLGTRRTAHQLRLGSRSEIRDDVELGNSGRSDLWSS